MTDDNPRDETCSRPPSSIECRERFASRLREARIDTKRFIDVLDGEKGTRDHTQHKPDDPRLSGNYGVYPGTGAGDDGDGYLVDVDIDDYDDDADSDALEAVLSLPETFTVATPHTDGDRGGHRYYHVTGDIIAAVETITRGGTNPVPTWGEMRVQNQYVVGPGSQLNACDRDGCDDCADPEGGYYTIATDAPIATITADDLVDVLLTDPAYPKDDTPGEERPSATADGGVQTASPSSNHGVDAPGNGLNDDEVVKKAMNAENGEYFADLWNGNWERHTWRWDNNSHSEARSALVGKLAFWTGGDRAQMRRLFQRSSLAQQQPEKSMRDFDDYLADKILPGRTEFYAPDGCATTSTPRPPVPEDADGITSTEVLWEAANDPVSPIELDDDGTLDTSLRSLRDAEIAEYVWDLAIARDLDDALAILDGPLYRYDDGVWHRDLDGQGVRMLGRDALGSAYSRGVKRELEERVRATHSVDADALGAPAGTIATADGLLDLDTRETRPLERTDRALHKLPIVPDVDAEAPKFQAFLDDSVADSDREKLQECAGYLLWHHAQPFGKALFLLGPTDSGKGTFLRMLKGVLGGDDAPLAAESLSDLTGRWGAANLYGKWANVRNEVTPGDVRHVERFKEYTGGGDRISAEFKGENKFEFDVTQKFVFAMNQMPDVEDADRAFWNRLLLVEFPDTVPPDEQDPALAADIIADEGAGVLNWLLDGLDRLLTQEQFTDERGISEKRKLCGAYGDVLDRFREDVLDITGDDADIVVKADLMHLATAYADKHDMPTTWNAQAGFTRELKALGVDGMETRQLGDDSDKDNVYLGVTVDTDMVDTLNADVKHGRLYQTDPGNDDPQQTLD